MKLSLDWLKDYVDIKISPKEMAERLTLSGTAVDRIEYQKEQYNKIIVAEIIEIKPHSKADKLQLAIVRSKIRKHQIVCGAPNIAVGQKVPLALPGARLPNGLVIKEVKIRGELSDGMLCSARELELADDHSGILILDKKARVGEAVAKLLGLDDVIFDLALTPNRGDCFSVRGIAREVAAVTKSKLKSPGLKLQLETHSCRGEELEIKIESQDLCPKYCVLVVKNVKVGESPAWLKRRLLAGGSRPINNIVDITNYLMLDSGEPLHAFDLSKIKKQKSRSKNQEKIVIDVRKARPGENITTLDGQNRELGKSMLVITDGEKPIALAGLMGGTDTEVSAETKDIVLEAAVFNPVSIRQTYRKLGLRTEAAVRFEKGIDWYLPELALSQAAQLLKEIAGGEVAGGIIKNSCPDPQPVSFKVDILYINKLLGKQFAVSEARDLLESLDIKVNYNGAEKFMVTIPSWRSDLKIPADIVEEIGRLYDYNQLKPVAIKANLQPPPTSYFYDFKRQIKEVFKSLGYNEVYTYSFYSDQEAKFIADSRHLELLNPISLDQQYLRHSLLPLILRKASMNLRFFDEIYIFELGTVFKNSKDSGGTSLPKEEIYLAGAISKKDQSAYQLYRRLKGDVNILFKELGILIKEWSMVNDEQVIFEKEGPFIDINYQNEWLGQIYIIEDEHKQEYKIRQETLLFYFDVTALFTLFDETKTYTLIPEFPSLFRDLSFVVPSNLKYQDLVNQIIDASSFIQNVRLVDEYFLAGQRRSLTIRITYRSNERTLKSAEVEEIEKRLLAELEGELGVKLRA